MRRSKQPEKTGYLFLLVLVVLAGSIAGALMTTRFALGTQGSRLDKSATPKVMRAERFELVSEGGELRAALVPLEDHVGVLLFDSNRKPHVLLELGETAVRFELVDRALGEPAGPVAKSLSEFWHLPYSVSPHRDAADSRP